MIGSSSELFDGPLDAHDMRIASVQRARRSDPRRYSTGLENVDASAKPLQPGGFCVIAAREGQGKTSLALRCAMTNASEHRVLFVSLDMRVDTIQDRILSHSMQMDSEHVNFLERQGDPHFARTMTRLGEYDLMVWRPKKGAKTVEKIIKRAEDVDAAILMIDYSRLIDGWDYGKRAADIVDTLADWTQESMRLTILLAQLNDEAVNRRPHNGHIQDTKQLVHRADRITLLYRPYKGKAPQKDVIAEVLTTKNRWGFELTNHAGWIPETMSYYPLDAEEEARATCCHKPATKSKFPAPDSASG